MFDLPRMARKNQRPRKSQKTATQGFPCKILALSVLSTVLCSTFNSASSWAALTPEQETRRLAQFLKPITNEVWAQIAGERAAQQYEIVQGDNLYDISKRLFGDPKYWPKIWALNNGRILNPHLILPGKSVAFLSGSGSSLPSVGLQNGDSKNTGDDAEAGALYGSDRSQEWRNLPPQPWEDVSLALPPNIDPQGFDRNNRITFSEATGFDLNHFQSIEEFPILGTITGSRSEALSLMLGDAVYMKSVKGLQVGETYTLTSEPIRIRGQKTGNKTYSYLNLGKIKVIGVRDGLFVGTVVASYHPTVRGDSLIENLKRVNEPEPIPGPSPIEASIALDGRITTTNASQFKEVYIDRGTEDGIQPGMVFRSYQHIDPATGKVITDADFIIQSDFLVVRCTEKFSEAIAINGVGIVPEKTSVVLLTDIDDLFKGRDGIDHQGESDQDLDELDRLDPGGGLGDKERRELKQLEKWKSDKESEDTVSPPPAEGEPIEEAPVQEVPEDGQDQTPTAPLTEPSNEAVPENSIEAPSEVPPEAPADAPSEPSTEAPTEAPTETPTEAPSVSPSETPDSSGEPAPEPIEEITE